MPEKNDASVVSISSAPGLCGRRGGSGHRASTWGDSGARGGASRHGGSKPPYVGMMAAVVAGRVPADFVLAMGKGTVRFAGGESQVAVIVGGIISESGAGRKSDRSAAVHPCFDDNIGCARNLRMGGGSRRGCRVIPAGGL